MFSRVILALSFAACGVIAHAQTHQTMYVEGNVLYDKCGSPVTLHGVNYPVLDDWDFPATSEVSAQIAQSGANSVRIQWYIDYGQPTRPAYALKDLDTVVSRIARLDMVPIIELHDFTCDTGFGALASDIVPWFTQPAVLDLIDKHKAYLIINLANEYGTVNWSGTPASAQVNFQAAYTSAVGALRTAGIQVPIMIDAPDCGVSADRLMNVASAINTGDPQHNVIFSVHAYWYAYANNDTVVMRNNIQQMGGSGRCFVLGEVANFQDENGVYCVYPLNHGAIIRAAESFKVGWLVWSWYKDGCAQRQMSTNGNFASLSNFGNDVINNSGYGLLNVSEKSAYLLNNGCVPLGISVSSDEDVKVYPNPADHAVYISGLPDHGTFTYSLADVTGRTVYQKTFSGGTLEIPLQTLPAGIYTLNRDGRFLKKIIVRH